MDSKKRTVIWIIVSSLISLLIIVYLYNVNTPLKPSDAEQKRVLSMLQDYAKQQWGGRVIAHKFEVKLESQASDFPFNHEWEEYRYFIYFRIKQNDAIFFASLPLEIQYNEINEWWMLSSKLNKKEIELLKAYSKISNKPAGTWFNEDSENIDSKEQGTTWKVQPVALVETFSNSFDEYIFEQSKNGKFRLVQRP